MREGLVLKHDEPKSITFYHSFRKQSKVPTPLHDKELLELWCCNLWHTLHTLVVADIFTNVPPPNTCSRSSPTIITTTLNMCFRSITHTLSLTPTCITDNEERLLHLFIPSTYMKITLSTSECGYLPTYLLELFVKCSKSRMKFFIKGSIEVEMLSEYV
jgi:hypothetical protein